MYLMLSMGIEFTEPIVVRDGGVIELLAELCTGIALIDQVVVSLVFWVVVVAVVQSFAFSVDEFVAESVF